MIYRVGATGVDLADSGAPVFLDEFTPGGTLVQSVAMPTTVNGSQRQLVASGLNVTEGMLTRSGDARYLVMTGYATNVGTSPLTTTASASVPRVIGRVDSAGAIDTTTALTGFSTGNVPRTATSSNGVDLWAGSGTGGSQGGLIYVTLGNPASMIVLSSQPQLRRNVAIFDGQLYTSSDGGQGARSVEAVGTGLPTSGPQLSTAIPGLGATGTQPSPFAFFFADLSAAVPGSDTLYVANDDGQGLRKFSFVSGTWIASGSIGGDADDYRGLTGVVSGNTVTLYATRHGGNTAAGGGELVSIVDASGYNAAINATPTLLATAATQTAFRGIALAPINPVSNQPPVNSAPAGPVLGTEDTNLAFSGLNAITVSDPDAGTANLTTTISVADATLGTFAATSNGGTALVTTSNGGATLTIVGPPLQINLALQTLNFSPAANWNFPADGSVGVTIVTTDGSASDTDSFQVNINELNDPPVVIADSLGDIGTEDGTAINIPVANVLLNDSRGAPNESSQTLTVTAVGSPTGGTVQLVGTTIIFTPTANFSGNASFEYTIQDNGTNAGMPAALTGSGLASLVIGGVNDAPGFVKGADQNVPANSSPQTVASWATAISAGPNESSQTVTFNVTNNTNAGLFTAGGQPAVASNGTLTYTPAPGATGSAAITLVAMDDGGTASGGVNVSPPQSFVITVTAAPVNLPPTISAISNLTILEGTPLQTINFSGVTAGGDLPAQAIAVTASSSNASLVPISVNYTSPNSTGTLTFTSPTNGNGSSTVTVTVRDAGLDLTLNTADDGLTAISFTVNVTAVNDVPAFVIGANQTANEDAGAQNVTGFATAISAGPNNENTQTLTFNVTGNSNAALFAAGPALAANGTLTYTPVANANGNATITVTLADNGGTANGGVDTTPPQSFTITVNPVNDAPTIAVLGDQTVGFGAGAQSVPGFASVVSVGPPNEAGQTVAFNITGNSNPALFAAGPSIAPNGTLTYTPAVGATGSATITIVGQDNGGTTNGGSDTSAPQSFTVTVSAAANAPPTIDPIPNRTILEGDPLQTINLSGITAGGDIPSQAIAVTASSSNGSLVPVNVNYASPGTTGTLTFTAPVNGNGSSTVTVTVRDAGLDLTLNTADDGLTTTSFNVTVTAVNDQPSFTAGNPPAVNEDAAAQSVVGFITGFTAGPNNENTQAVSAYLVSNVSNPPLFTVPPAVSNSGVLTYTLAANASGNSTFDVRVRDSGGTANGGIDLSSGQTFTLTVNSVNDAPSFNVGQNQTLPGNPLPQSIPNWATGISAGPTNEGSQNVRFVVTGNSNPGLFATPPAIASNGTLTYVPASGATGTSTITVVAQDTGGTANGGVDTSPPQSFTVTILPNQPPVANDSTFPAVINTPVSGFVSATDIDGPALTYSLVMNPALGTISAFTATTGAFTYTPTAGATGLDVFSFSVTDGTNSDTGLVRIAIQGTQPVVTPSGGDLLVIGTPEPDTIIITHFAAGVVRVRTDLSTALYPVTNGLIVNSGEGNDYVVASGILVHTTLDLAGGDDYASGGLQNDLIIGGVGNDQINAGSGDNIVWGDNVGEQDLIAGGNDVLSSLGGNDVFFGGGGDDQLQPGAGDDYVQAGAGDDFVSAGAGDDRVFGGAGSDQLFGDEGHDILVGGAGADQLVGRTGNDLLIGGTGGDLLNGDEGSDLLVAGELTTTNSSTPADESDLALLALLASWNAAHPAGLVTSTLAGNDNAVDSLQGYTGDDDFYRAANDSASDFSLPFLGNDRQFIS